jgi:hypothetical protein
VGACAKLSLSTDCLLQDCDLEFKNSSEAQSAGNESKNSADVQLAGNGIKSLQVQDASAFVCSIQVFRHVESPRYIFMQMGMVMMDFSAAPFLGKFGSNVGESTLTFSVCDSTLTFSVCESTLTFNVCENTLAFNVG